MINDAKTAQWHLERGADERGNGFVCLIFSVCLPPLIPILWPLAVACFIKGRKLRAKGKEMNEAAGLSNVERPIQVNTPWSGYVFDTARPGQVSHQPPVA